MKNFVLATGSALLLVFSSCKKQEPDSPVTETVSGSQAIIPWQDCAFFIDHDITICFVEATDSRCPCDAYCIWAGALNVRLHVTGTTGLDTTIQLTTNNEVINNVPTEATVGGKTLRFEDSMSQADFCENRGNYATYKILVKVE